MNFDNACKNYVSLRKEVDEIERKAKADSVVLKEKMLALETWLTLKADEDGLENIKTAHGTVYWSIISSAKVASRDAFLDFVRSKEAYDMLENRVSKEAVKSYMEANNGLVPPGVDFSQIRKFNLRIASEKD